MFKPIQERRIEVELSTSNLSLAQSIFRKIVANLFAEVIFLKFSKQGEETTLELRAITFCNSDVLQDLVTEMSECDLKNFLVENLSKERKISEELEECSTEVNTKTEDSTQDETTETKKTVKRIKNECLLPSEILEGASKTKTLHELATFISNYFSYPVEFTPQLVYIFDRAMTLIINGEKVTWDNLLDGSILNSLIYKKQFVTPFNAKLGSSIRFPAFVRKVINSFYSANREVCRNNEEESSTSPEKLTFADVIENKAFLDNPTILGAEAEEFFSLLKTLTESELDLKERVRKLYSYMYLKTSGNEFSDESNEYFIDFLTYTLSQDNILENGIEGKEYNNFHIDAALSESKEDALLRIFLSTGQTVFRFVEQLTGEKMKLREFLTAIKPLLLKDFINNF